MIKVLVLSRRDWLHPQAGPQEQYIHEVFWRLAKQGCYVALVAPNFPFWNPKRQRARVEVVDQIQVIRPGSGLLFRFVTRMFVKRLLRSSKPASNFNVLVDCVHGNPYALSDLPDIPVLPLVFHLDRKVFASGDAPGPVVAATAAAYEQLMKAGFADGDVLQAFGAPEEAAGTAWDETANTILTALQRL